MSENKPIKRRNYTIAVKDLLPRIGKRIGYENNRYDISLRINWQKIIGAELAAQITPIGIKHQGHKKTLLARCPQGAGLALSYAQAEISERINRYFGKEIVNNIRLMPEIMPSKQKSPSPLPEKPRDSETQEEKLWLYRALQNLSEKM